MQVSRHWRIKQQRYSLVGEVCPNCDARIFPPRDVCPDCGEDARTLFHFSGHGRIYSFTMLHEAPSGLQDQAPYTLALVQLDEGPMLTAQLTDLGQQHVEIGMPVEMVTRRLGTDGDEGPIIYGYKFRPAIR
jgi:uncharacterized OB-fold protein